RIAPGAGCGRCKMRCVYPIVGPGLQRFQSVEMRRRYQGSAVEVATGKGLQLSTILRWRARLDRRCDHAADPGYDKQVPSLPRTGRTIRRMVSGVAQISLRSPDNECVELSGFRG